MADRPGGRSRPWWRRPFVVIAASYLAGAIPFSNLMAKRRRGVDLRTVGPGTVSGTSLYEVAGFGALAVAGICDIAKGAVGPALAGRDRPGLQAAVCAAAVAGHNWSPFLSGAGGRGISPAIGALAAAGPGGRTAFPRWAAPVPADSLFDRGPAFCSDPVVASAVYAAPHYAAPVVVASPVYAPAVAYA